MADGGHEMGNSDILSHDELALLVNHPEDINILRRMKSMSQEELQFIDQNYGPTFKNLPHYIRVQEEWINTSKYLLGIRLKRCPNESEYMRDYCDNTASRFRVFYVMKYPDMSQGNNEIADHRLKEALRSSDRAEHKHHLLLAG